MEYRQREYEERIRSYEKAIAELTDKKKVLENEMQELESRKDVKDVELENAERKVLEKRKEVEREERRLSVAKEMYENYRDTGTMMDKMVDLQMQVYELQEANATLRQKLKQAYDFMKTKFLNGINMFEEFVRSVGVKVQDIFEDKNRGAR